MLYQHLGCSVTPSCLKFFCDPHGLQPARLSCSSLCPRVSSNSYSLSQWCHPNISFSVALFPSAFNLSEHQSLFQWVSCSHQVPKYWSCSISPSKEYSGLISFKIYWFDLLTFQGTQEPSPAPQFESINSSVFWLLYCSVLISVHD